jgi:hypothetical protein
MYSLSDAIDDWWGACTLDELVLFNFSWTEMCFWKSSCRIKVALQ